MDTSNAAVTFGDLAGFTALTEAHGDIAAADLAEQLVADAESVLGVGDRLVKAIGDAVLLTFPGAASAITLTLRLFDACERDARFPDLRAGLHYDRSSNGAAMSSARRSMSRPDLPRKPEVDRFLPPAPSRMPRRRSVFRCADWDA